MTSFFKKNIWQFTALEICPIALKLFPPMQVQNFVPNTPSKNFPKTFNDMTKVANFHQIWSHCQSSVTEFDGGAAACDQIAILCFIFGHLQL